MKEIDYNGNRVNYIWNDKLFIVSSIWYQLLGLAFSLFISWGAQKKSSTITISNGDRVYYSMVEN